jgi:hypothetical protein
LVEVDGILIEAPGLTGEVTVAQPGARRGQPGVPEPRPGARGAPSTRPGRAPRGPVADAMRANGMATRRVVTIDRVREAPRPPVGARVGARAGAKAPAPAIDLTVPAPAPGDAQVVLYTDEHGVKTWHFAVPEKAAGRRAIPRGGGRSQQFSIRRTAPVPVAGALPPGVRGIPGLSKIIEIVTFPIAEIASSGVDFAVGAWDRKEHPHRIRVLDGHAWRAPTNEDLNSLSKGPVLLFVHGTFSTTEGAFSALPEATMAKLGDRYKGRVIAFDHPTISDDPIVNAREFFKQVGNRKLELDIVCHSRGGLVARAIAEQPDGVKGSDAVHVRQIVLVGVPNAGTILADAGHWNELVDRFTTILSLAPLPGASDVLESVFALVRSIAVGTAKKLDGLAAMTPNGPFLKKFNAARPTVGDTKYLAIVSDYEPKNPGLKAWLNDEIRDRIFDEQPNDMMVRIDSMGGDALAKPFPVAKVDRSAFVSADAIEHAFYFPEPKTSAALLKWLKG